MKTSRKRFSKYSGYRIRALILIWHYVIFSLCFAAFSKRDYQVILNRGVFAAAVLHDQFSLLRGSQRSSVLHCVSLIVSGWTKNVIKSSLAEKHELWNTEATLPVVSQCIECGRIFACHVHECSIGGGVEGKAGRTVWELVEVPK